MEPADLLSLRSDDRAALLLVGLRGDWQPYCCAQAVRLARSLPRLSAAGTEVVLASVDPPEVQVAMNETWFLPFRWVSDPGGTSLAKPLGAWNPDREVFKPLVLAVAPDGREVFRELSRDFTDRPDDEPVLAALESLALDPVDMPPWRPADVEPQPSDKAFKPASFIPYFRAIKMNTMALAERMVDERDRDQLLTENRMADSFLTAFDEWRAEHPPSEQRQPRRTLLAADLVDELRLLVFPVVVGPGKRLFADGAVPRAWRSTRPRPPGPAS